MYARHQAALTELVQAVRANTALPNLLQQTATLVANTLAVPYCALWELRSDQHLWVLRAHVGWPPHAAGQPATEAAASLLDASVVAAQPVAVAEWSRESTFELAPVLRQKGVESSAYVSIPGQTQPFGSLGVDVDAARLFNDEELSFLTATATIVALAHEHIQHQETLDQRIAATLERATREERQRLARDLHDTMTQALYGMTLHAKATERLLARGDTVPAMHSLEALQNAAQHALDEVRLAIFELRTPSVEKLGLVMALQARLDAVEGRGNLATTLTADPFDDLPPNTAQELYLIAQEALNNALRHARAQHIDVYLRYLHTAVVLEINDDGIGFEPIAARSSGGTGLQNIAERVIQLGGTYTLQNSHGAGTHLRVEVPL